MREIMIFEKKDGSDDIEITLDRDKVSVYCGKQATAQTLIEVVEDIKAYLQEKSDKDIWLEAQARHDLDLEASK